MMDVQPRVVNHPSWTWFFFISPVEVFDHILGVVELTGVGVIPCQIVLVTFSFNAVLEAAL